MVVATCNIKPFYFINVKCNFFKAYPCLLIDSVILSNFQKSQIKIIIHLRENRMFTLHLSALRGEQTASLWGSD